MKIAAGRIVLDFYGNTVLKKKQELVETLCKDLRKKFNLSALEVDEFDELEKCAFGFAAVIPTDWKTQSAQSFLDKIVQEINDISPARVTVEDTEIVNYT